MLFVISKKWIPPELQDMCTMIYKTATDSHVCLFTET